MISSQFCESGIAAVGPLLWGTHFCQFYKTREDLVETLVPYIATGLRNNEACLWVTSQPLVAEEAKAALSQVVPDYEQYLEAGQIEIMDFEDWYIALGDVDADHVLAAWIERQQQALNRGYQGLRLTGNTFWLERSGWNDFMEYERKVNENFGKFRILGLCTYSLDRCGAEEVIDVVRNHEFAVALRQGEWEVVESASVKVAKGELNRLNRELETRISERTAELRTALRGREDYMAVLAHELRNPLGAISNAVTVLEQANPESPAHRKALTVARRQIQQQTRMVDDLLDVSRITHGTFDLRKETLDLCDLCRRSAEDYRKGIEQLGLRFQTALPAEPVWIEGDSARITQVLSNLLDNAAKFTPTGGEVALGLEQIEASAQALLTVSDTGVGIAAELLPHVFDPFTQAEQSLDRTRGGLGLGLALVQGIAELHGGEVQAESAGTGTGTTMSVRFPLTRVRITEHCLEPEVTLPPATLRVLVIEDLADTAETLHDLLELWGYSVEVALSGVAGVEAARRWHPDVVLCDLGLPGMDGYEVARQLRLDPSIRGVHLVAVTGYSGELVRQRTTEVGFDGHFIKPLDVEALRRFLASRAALNVG
ncbi:MAG: hypothetical protein K0Q72_2791 [Armatimonadetes bacterium]|nr:hypothetical protein [Armatimonadota bacterium]